MQITTQKERYKTANRNIIQPSVRQDNLSPLNYQKNAAVRTNAKILPFLDLSPLHLKQQHFTINGKMNMDGLLC